MRALAAGVLLVGTACVLAGCSADVADARSQWRIVVGTDAPVPAFGDRVLVEVLDDAGRACTACRRELGAALGRWPISFGVVPAPGFEEPLLHVVLFRTTVTGPDGRPASDRVIETLVRLPPTSGVSQVGIELGMRCFGTRIDAAGGRACNPATGALAPIATAAPVSDPSALPSPGSWPPAREMPCDGAAPEGMVCVPGGAFLLGSPQFLPLGDLDPVPEQLVQVAPFFLDVDEMTVGELRALVDAKLVPAPQKQGSGPAARCTYTPAPTNDSEAMPVNCVSFQIARAACEALGKYVPSEAQWEWAAGNGGRETLFPWGDDDPCAHALIAVADPLTDEGSVACLEDGEPSGLRPGGSPDDVTASGLVNLGGSLGEWTSDKLVPYADPACWGPSATLHVDPICPIGNAQSARGGYWSAPAFAAQVSVRGGYDAGGIAPETGVRCAR